MDIELMNHLKVAPGLKKKKFIIMGFGNVGYWAAHYFHNAGAIVVGISEWDGSVYDSKGIDPEKLLAYK
jgi:glutamate dehydrogenase (NAD(P)+)